MNAKKVIIGICRILVGALFIFSGFIKANDPLGFSYKLDEYFGVFGVTRFFPDPTTVYLSMIICVFEIFVGICLLVGVFRNFTAWMLLLMIIFFSFLTFYSAYFNKVTDCGCFGDALHLKPWQSFTKDMILLVLILPIFFNRQYINPLFGKRSSRMVALLVMLASVLFTIFAYYYMPFIDFRPYAVGKDIQSEMIIPPGALKDSTVMTFVYKNNKTGEKVEFSMSDLSHLDSVKAAQYTFVTRKDKKIREGYKPPIHDFSIQGKDSDVTKSFLAEKGYRLMIVQYDIEKSNTRAQPELNKLVRHLIQDSKVKIWPLSGSSSAMNDNYIKKNHVPYTFYSADVTMLKTIVRSNPGLVLFHDNVVVRQWPSTALPSIEKIYANMK